jgi:hypothetical protein
MVAFRMKESKFGAPVGVYVAKFLGIQPMKNESKVGRDGKPMGPAVEWQFEIVEGDHVGQIVGRITPAEPTSRNICGTLLNGLFGRTISPEEDVDTDPFIGKLYQVVISPGKENPEKTNVSQINQIKAKAPAQTSTPRSAPAPPTKPRPAAPKPAAATPESQPGPSDATLFWVDDGSGEPTEWTAGDIRQKLREATIKESDIKVMTHDQASGWKTPAELLISVPF